MIYITGDMHGDFRRFGAKWFKDQKEMTKDDTLIILGDFGGIWSNDGETEHEKYQLDWLEGKNYTTVFIDGILDPVADAEKIKEWYWDYSKLFRIKGVTWWPEEMPTDEEMQHGIDTLADHDNKVDYLLMHSPATSVLNLMGRGRYTPDKLSNYLDDVRANTEFKRHFMGHMHIDWELNETDWLMYEEIIRIN